ncbi:MAG: Zinc-ribbon domain protein [Acidobacteria bacterium]|nr:Zinc-ribbon domain protein [Acidobacteriota bacterium]
MYCSSCGGAVARSLTYCNHCGAKLGSSQEDKIQRRSEQHHENLVWAIVGALAIGLGGIIGMMAVMKEVVHFDVGLIIAFTLFCFTLVFAVEGVLIWQLLSRRTQKKDAGDTARISRQTTNELDGDMARALPEPVASVTEQTTRAFEPVYSDRK